MVSARPYDVTSSVSIPYLGAVIHVVRQGNMVSRVILGSNEPAHFVFYFTAAMKASTAVVNSCTQPWCSGVARLCFSLTRKPDSLRVVLFTL